jgi:hypothetical protein
MDNDLSSKQNVLFFIQNEIKFNLSEMENYDTETLKIIECKIDYLLNSIDKFFSYYLLNNTSIEVNIYDKSQAFKASEKTGFTELFGYLKTGWILGKKGVHFYFANEMKFSLSYKEMSNVEWFKVNKIFSSDVCSFKNNNGKYIGVPCDLMESYRLFFKQMYDSQLIWSNVIQDIKRSLIYYLELIIKKELLISQNNLLISKNNYIKELDKYSTGEVDLIENNFDKLLAINQNIILEIDDKFIHQFVKVSKYLKTKKQNTQKIFKSILDSNSQVELEERINLLKNQIHAYELLVFHSLNMIGAIVSKDMIIFYEIYESFDKLQIYNSNWENEVSEKLNDIGHKLDNVMYSIYKMELKIVNELNNLNYFTQSSFESLNTSLSGQLKEIESSINTNNLLNGIQAYQLYKINNNIKGLNL